MRNEVKILELKRRQLSPVMEGAWDTVLGYFRLAHHRRQLTKDRLELVRGTMSSNVIYNSKFGLKSMVRSWFCLQWFGDVEEELENVNKATPNSMIASTRTSVTITHQTLTNVFPHLLCDSDLRLVANSMIASQRIVMCGSVCFVWCGTSERVSSVTTQSDMLTPMLQLLGNWEDASRVFENALISPDFQWRDL
ncbi:hypothetical protein PHMEG_00018057 [Phytophthora megakarya]|uniref:Uncharacterized protein n=1 Tax=Phytophthora megakarya TaxID=4795 RepID=A0A225VV89_9STRA|nr:hypothetical protein PHMEG_00018057 [Phytophthora megakarya]